MPFLMMTTPPGFGVTVDVTVEFGGKHNSLVGVDVVEAGTAVMIIPGGSFVGVADLRPKPTLTKVAFRFAAADNNPGSSSSEFSSSV